MTRPKPADGEYCVFLRNLALDLPIGILPEERLAPQPVVINVEMYLADPGQFVSEDIADYVSYADVFDDIRQIQAEGHHIELVENLADRIAAIALAREPVRRVIVSVDKPAIIPETETVGIVIERR